MFIRRSQVFRAGLLLIVVGWTLVLVLKRNQPISRIRFNARPFRPYECPPTEDNLDVVFNTSTYLPLNAQQRVLLIKDPHSNAHSGLLDHLQHLKLPVRVESILEDEDLLLESQNVGRFSLIIFANYRTYELLSNVSKSILELYASSHQVGIISFAPQQKSVDAKTKLEFSTTAQLQFVSESGVPRIARSDVLFNFVIQSKRAWTLISVEGWQSILTVTFDDETTGAAVAIRRTPFQHVLFGHLLNEWPLKLAFIDVLHYFLGSGVVGNLERYIQIDIDDIFVGQSGALLLEDDVNELIRTQNEWRSFVHDFKFTLGFSGYYFRHGTDAEKRGDLRLIEKADQFVWFPHMWRHNHAHEYDVTNLTAFMMQNKQFALDKNLNVSSSYAVAPQHSGVYPVHDDLYEAWRRVWGISVSSTEEYPHFSPASQRSGFIHANISVLPRQTCGLYTHTLHFHAMPDGLQKHLDSIQGGSLFTSILFNEHSIFMTHQQNFANDRLAVFTFSNLFQFLKCWTNVRLKWVPPVELACRYFDRFPSEETLLYTDVCDDRRHSRMLANKSDCNDLNRTPNLLIVGPQKTGTTALREFLLLHPNVSSNRMISGGYFEEPQFFGGPNYRRGPVWYRSLFNGTSTTVVFEKSANYFDNPRAPKAVASLVPNAKIVVVLIDPVDRAYSWYQHAKAHKDPPTVNLTAEEIFLNPTNDWKVLKLRSRCLAPGFYVEHLERWMDFYSPSQIVIVDGAELRESPADVMVDLTKRLTLSDAFDYRKSLVFDERKGFFCIGSRAGRRCLGVGKGRRYDPMSSELRRELRRVYETTNHNLFEFLKRYGLKIPKFLRTN